jgi:hypothetical protein
MKDHCAVPFAAFLHPGLSDRHTFSVDQARLAAAKQQWEKDRTEPLAFYNHGIAMGFYKLRQQKFDSIFGLDNSESLHLARPTVPHYEISIVCEPYLLPAPGNTNLVRRVDHLQHVSSLILIPT